MQISINWKRYITFFDLYDHEKDEPILIYIIGEEHHCYIGCVGCDGGSKGLASRYQKQYVDRAVSIYGRDKCDGQVAFAGKITSPTDPSDELIEDVEKNIQDMYLKVHGKDKAEFKLKGSVRKLDIRHVGDLPKFINDL